MIPLFKVFNDVVPASENVRSVLESGYVGQGSWCNRFEDELVALTGHDRALYVNSGTSALILALQLSGVCAGTEVISSPITCLATNAAIHALGAKIVWADVDRKTGNIDPTDASRKVTNRTRAIIAVDWGGRICDFAGLRARTRGISLIEDAAHALLSQGSSRGDLICYSFQAIKLLNTADGGGLICPSSAMHERAKLLRWFGLDRTRSDAMRCYQPVSEVGWKFQGNDVLASIGCANIKHAKELVEKHRWNATYLYNAISGVPLVSVPELDVGSSHWLFTILVSSPAAFEEFMRRRGIAVSQVHARNDIYQCFKGSDVGGLPGVDHFASHQVSIPCGWWLSETDLKSVISSVSEWSKSSEARWSSE